MGPRVVLALLAVSTGVLVGCGSKSVDPAKVQEELQQQTPAEVRESPSESKIDDGFRMGGKG
jgi:hypothetical protein